eukprot:TRINITY_DN10073_c0_g1_i1.p1 TRINITY_DN10073_c0_g1~~TRINITY_DN10073_c0_g1_i1.p1  ORF type:complete len:357 (-),score=71.04 TRINITY_DN10073_c0_g1_i1:42-1112(-)
MASWRCEGPLGVKHRLVCAVLSGRPIKIDNIRADSKNPGISEAEASFLRLLEKVTNGSSIDINETGTTVSVNPGVIEGGKITHECGLGRSIGYFAEALILLGLFGKKPLVATLKGITNDNIDISVDLLRTVTIHILRPFGVDEGVAIKINSRGAPPLGGGEILLRVPVIRELQSVQLTNFGKVKRVRGLCYSTRVNAQLSQRTATSSKGPLLKFIPDVYVYTDGYKGKESGKSPGYAVSLVASTTEGANVGAEYCSVPDWTPEELGEYAARQLLQEISYAPCVDSLNQGFLLTLLALCPEDVSRVRLGPLTKNAIQTLRNLNDIFNVKFKLLEDDNGGTMVTAMGMGFSNVQRKMQ